MTADGTGSIVLSVRGMTKSFGPTVALTDASFELRSGEVHALVGENGSGKSTLVKILSGVHRPDAGSIVLDGREHAFLRSPRDAQRAGISTVFQEILTVEPRTVFENLWLGVTVRGLSRSARRARSAELLAELMENPPRLDTVVEELSLSDRQVCSIARVLLRDPRVLILDEATSSLDYDSRRRLFEHVRSRGARGSAVVLISHKMDEIDEIGDRVTVLRSGRTVGSLARGAWDRGRLVSLMTGAESLTGGAHERVGRMDGALGEAVLEVRDLHLTRNAAPIDVTVRRGEFLGLAGLEGQGQDAFLRALWGAQVAAGEVVKLGGAGTRRDDAGEQRITSRRAAARLRIAYVPGDRRRESVFEQLSILDNFTLPTIRADRRGLLISLAASRARFAEYRERLKIKLGSLGDEMRTLSGGNQQKVVIARWLALHPEVLLLNDPTRGIDINAKRDLYAHLEELAADGVAVVMLSTEVDELVELADRVLVFRDDSIAAELDRTELTPDRLVGSYFGEKAA